MQFGVVVFSRSEFGGLKSTAGNKEEFAGITLGSFVGSTQMPRVWPFGWVEGVRFASIFC